MQRSMKIALAILWFSRATLALAQTSDADPPREATDSTATAPADEVVATDQPTATSTTDDGDDAGTTPDAGQTATPDEAASESDDDEAALAAELTAELGGGAAGAEPEAAPTPETSGGGGGGGGGGGVALGRVLMLPNISLILTSGLWYFSDRPTRRPSGHDPTANASGFRFQLQEIELAFQAAIDPYLRADVFFALGLDQIEVEEAYLTTTGLPAGLQLRAGQMYARIGRFNTQHFLETQPFVDAPLVNRHFFSSEQVRGLGAELSWLAPLPWYVEVSAQMLTANNEQSFGVPVDQTRHARDFLAVGHLDQFFALSDTWSVKWGLSYAQGPNITGGLEHTAHDRTQIFGSDLYLKWRDLQSHRYVALQSEFLLRRADVEGGRVTEGGLYAHLDARLSQNWQLATRFDWLGLPSKVSGAPDFGVTTAPAMEPFTPFAQWRAALAVSYYFSEFQRWRLQYGIDRLQSGPAGVVASRDPVHEVFLEYQVVMGSHGAHPF